tara:strand:+ start:741 stop:1049 length:309 start_codon:yes stop_codon:yes gene_type:complete
MKFLKSRLDRFDQKIREKDWKGVIRSMDNYLRFGLGEMSVSAHLIQELREFNQAIEAASAECKLEKSNGAKAMIARARDKLPLIEDLIKKIAKGEKRFKRSM